MNEPTFKTCNPSNGEALGEYRYHVDQEVDVTLSRADQAYNQNLQYPEASFISDRANFLSQLAEKFRERRTELATCLTLEMGKPLTDSLAEIEKSAAALQHYSEKLPELIQNQTIEGNYREVKLVKEPMGPLLTIMPWNYPVWQLVRVAGPAVGLGNPIVLKHSEVVAGTANLIEEIFSSVNKNLLFQLRLTHAQCEKVIQDRRIRAVTLTGSAQAGSAVAMAAGKSLKKVVLELGGSDPYIVLADADVERAADICARSRMLNNGQSCIAAKRFIVEKSIKDKFLLAFEKAIKSMRWGDPMRMDVTVGPLAQKKFQTQLVQQRDFLQSIGGELLLEHHNLAQFSWADESAYFPFNIFDLSKALSSASEMQRAKLAGLEYFGPVAQFMTFEGDLQAVQLANESRFGLGAAIFSKDQERVNRMGKGLHCGLLAINDFVKSDVRVPFGGCKDSGFGKELGREGFDEFAHIKSICKY